MHSDRRFYQLLGIVAATLIVVSAVLGILLLHSGPRVRQVIPTLNPQGAVTTQSQTLRFVFDRPLPQLDLKPYFEVSPATPFDLRQDGQSVYLSFTQNLLLGADYRLTVKSGLHDEKGRTMRSDFTYRFRTASPHLLYVKRDYEAEDQIIEYDLSTEQSHVLMQSDMITRMVSNNTYLAAIQRNADGFDEVFVREWATGTTFKLQGLEPKSNIINVTLSSANQLAVVASTADGAVGNRLHRFSLAGTSVSKVGEPTPNIIELTYSRDGQVFVAKKTDTLFYLGSSNADPALTLLGEYFSVGNFNRTNDKLLVTTNTAVMYYDARAKQAFSLPELFNTNATVPVYLHNSDDIAYRSYKPGTGTFQTTVEVLRDKKVDSTLTLQDKEYFLGPISLSFDDRFVAVEISTSDQLYDDYRLNTKPEQTTIKIFDRQQQRYLPAKLTGVDPVWHE